MPRRTVPQPIPQLSEEFIGLTPAEQAKLMKEKYGIGTGFVQQPEKIPIPGSGGVYYRPPILTPEAPPEVEERVLKSRAKGKLEKLFMGMEPEEAGFRRRAIHAQARGGTLFSPLGRKRVTEVEAGIQGRRARLGEAAELGVEQFMKQKAFEKEQMEKSLAAMESYLARQEQGAIASMLPNIATIGISLLFPA